MLDQGYIYFVYVYSEDNGNTFKFECGFKALYAKVPVFDRAAIHEVFGNPKIIIWSINSTHTRIQLSADGVKLGGWSDEFQDRIDGCAVYLIAEVASAKGFVDSRSCSELLSMIEHVASQCTKVWTPRPPYDEE
ncbi:hypothetical protein GGI13_005189 [Coemansia sp. RSA 455]|nr:hypothetical protein GGI13_005189 [Coemansia sp. RSA 455]